MRIGLGLDLPAIQFQGATLVAGGSTPITSYTALESYMVSSSQDYDDFETHLVGATEDYTDFEAGTITQEEFSP